MEFLSNAETYELKRIFGAVELASGCPNGHPPCSVSCAHDSFVVRTWGPPAPALFRARMWDRPCSLRFPHICNIRIYVCNVHMKHSQHTSKTSKTLENIRLQHAHNISLLLGWIRASGAHGGAHGRRDESRRAWASDTGEASRPDGRTSYMKYYHIWWPFIFNVVFH
jgi:hypothetical protein